MTHFTHYVEERARMKCDSVIKNDNYLVKHSAVYYLELTTGMYTAYSPHFGPPPTSEELLRFRPCAGETYRPLVYTDSSKTPNEAHPAISRMFKDVEFMLLRKPDRLEKYWLDPTRQTHIVIMGPGNNNRPPPDYIILEALRKDPTFDPSDDMSKELWALYRDSYANYLGIYRRHYKQLAEDDQTWNRYIRHKPTAWNADPTEDEVDKLAVGPTLFIDAQLNIIRKPL